MPNPFDEALRLYREAKPDLARREYLRRKTNEALRVISPGPTTEEVDFATEEFLFLLERHVRRHPDRLKPVAARLAERIRVLAGEIRVDLSDGVTGQGAL